MNIIKVKDYEELSKKAAKIITGEINHNKHLVLGLATGSTPVGTYQELVKNYDNKLVTFKYTKAFFLDEYCLSHPRLFEYSNKYFLEYNFFSKINIEPENVFGFDQRIEESEKTIAQMDQHLAENPIDIMLLGIGQNGHIGYNEPGCSFESTTHLSKLSYKTRLANQRFFSFADEVPSYAITLGIKNILDAKKIILLASGSSKAEAIKELLSLKISTDFPASSLIHHPDVTIIIDEDACSLL